MTCPLTIICGDALSSLLELPDASVNCCVTSPPYWGLRDYGVAGQIGLEKTPDEFVSKLVAVFREVRRVLKDDGTLWMNLGDSYAVSGKGGNPDESPHKKQASNVGSVNGRTLRPTPGPGLKAKDMVGIPWMVAFALRADGWYLRSDIIWSKPNPMPESVTDRPTKAHEYLFLLSKSERYYYDQNAILEPASMATIERLAQNVEAQNGSSRAHAGGKTNGNMKAVGRATDKQRGHSRRHAGFNDRWDAMEKEEQCGGLRNKRTVWTIPTKGYAAAHFATYPPDLIKPCILAGCPVGGTILDPFGGSGTTGQVALELGRNAVLIELNPDYVDLIRQRCDVTRGLAL